MTTNPNEVTDEEVQRAVDGSHAVCTPMAHTAMRIVLENFVKSRTSATSDAAATEKANQWRPIADAPSDGTPMLVYHNRMVLEAWYSTQWGKFVVSETGGTHNISPSHFLPLPLPPTGTEQDKSC